MNSIPRGKTSYKVRSTYVRESAWHHDDTMRLVASSSESHVTTSCMLAASTHMHKVWGVGAAHLKRLTCAGKKVFQNRQTAVVDRSTCTTVPGNACLAGCSCTGKLRRPSPSRTSPLHLSCLMLTSHTRVVTVVMQLHCYK